MTELSPAGSAKNANRRGVGEVDMWKSYPLSIEQWVPLQRQAEEPDNPRSRSHGERDVLHSGDGLFIAVLQRMCCKNGSETELRPFGQPSHLAFLDMFRTS